MLYVNIPTREEILQLAEVRSDICVSIYLKTSPLPSHMEASRIEMGNMVKQAFASLRDAGFDKKRLEALQDALEAVLEADDFWFFHAHSLAVLASPDSIRTYRLANSLNSHIEVSDRFYMKPLMRALTFPHHAYILALSENEARVVEFFADAAPEVLNIPDMPKDAMSAIGRSSVEVSTGSLTRESGSRGPKMRLAQYARKVDEALRPLLLHHNSPLILVSTEPLAAIFRSVSSACNLVDEVIFTSPDRITLPDLVKLARPVLDRYYGEQLAEVQKQFELRAGQQRVVTDLADVAKAATYGMVSLVMVDFDKTVKGFIDEGGTLRFTEEPGAYSLIDEIVKRSLVCGAKVLAVREEDMKGDSGAAAILRYPL